MSAVYPERGMDRRPIKQHDQARSVALYHGENHAAGGIGQSRVHIGAGVEEHAGGR